MKNKKIFLVIAVSVFLLFSIATIIPTVQAGQFHIIKGTLYVDNTVMGAGAQIKVNILTETFTFDTFNPDINGYTFYLGAFDNDIYYGATAYFTVLYNNIWYTPIDNTSIILNKNTNPAVENYILDLHINTTTQEDTEPPSKVTGLTVIDAKDGKLDLSWNPATDNVAVDYYNIYCDEILINTKTTTTYQDTGLNNGQEYCYKISAVDTSNNEGEKSDQNCATPTHTTTPNNPPNKPINPIPANNSENIYLNPQLSVFVTDPDGDTLTVSFYNASNDQIIATVSNVQNATNAKVVWPSLSFNTYYHWYAIADDGEFKTRSDVFTFKTIEDDNIPPNIYFEKPEKGSLYIFGNKVFSGILKTPFILGKINIVVNAQDNESGISKVELSIKGKIREITGTLLDYPYSYEWSKLGFGKYDITANAYDMNGNSATTSMTVRKFL